MAAQNAPMTVDVAAETGTTNNVVIVDMANPAVPLRKPITADSTIIAPSSKVLALKAATAAEGGTQGDNLQVFNLDTKQKSPDPPSKVFDRTSNLNGTQIISYRVSPDMKWSTLVGIAPGSSEKPNLIKGFMQLYSVEQKRSQALEAHSAAFTTLEVGGKQTQAIVFTTKTYANSVMNSKIHCIALGGGAHKKNAELFFPSEFTDDFPVSLHISEKFGLAYVISKMGLLFVYSVDTLAAVYRQRISADPVFLAQAAPTSGGAYVITRRGSILKVDVSREAVVPFVAQSLKNVDLALKIASRGGLPGADPLFVQKFEKECNEGKWKEAAETAASAPSDVLRTQATITRLQAAPAVPGQKSPVLAYFGALLAKGGLNAVESVEMSRIAISQNKPELVKNWMVQNKLTASEPLGDLLKESNRDLARSIYETAGATDKLTMIYAEEGNVEQLVAASGGKAGEAPNYTYLLQNLLMTNPQGAVALAKAIIKQPGPPMDKATIANEFISRQLYAEATSFALEALSEDVAEEGAMQTKIIEINLMFKPEVADAILSGGQFSHYDRPRIAQLCEKAGLYMRAMEHYTDLADIRRVMANTHAIPPEALKEFFGERLSSDWAGECLGDLVQNPANVNLVVDIAVEYTDAMGGWEKVLAVLEKAPNAAQVEFAYLARRIATSEEPEEHYRYIVAASKCQQFQVVEQMTRESNFLDVDRVMGYLMDAKLADSRPLINICDRYDRVTELTAFLYKNNMRNYIEGYVQKVNPGKTPQVVGGLLDSQADEKFMSDLIMSVRSLLPVADLCAEVEKRNKLKLLDKFLKVLVEEGSQDPEVHNAMGKILIDANSNPEHFLQSNPFYQPAVVGKYCEKRDPHLACVAYKRGQCDDELIECTNKNSMYKLQARYLVERQDLDVYGKVLDPENEHRKAVVEQLVNTALPESKHPEMVSTCVKAFMAAGLQAELIKLLEMIVLQDSAFSSNQNLQNLLIITALKSDPSRVADYVHRLDGFEPKAVAQVALENGQPEAAFDMYRKAGMKIEALNTLVERIEDFDRAHEYATKVDDPATWSTLGHAQLARGHVNDAIGSYLLAKDSSKYLEVTSMAKETKQYDDLVRFLMMVRDKIKDPKVDTEIAIAYAMTDKLGELEAFITSPNQAQVQECGDRCYEEARYEAARILYLHIKNFGRLASCLVHLTRFNEAVDAARKANSPTTWKEVCFACVEVSEFKLAQLCGLNIITSADDLNEVCEFYMMRGHFPELISLLESGIGLERAHMGIFTALGEMYANHEPEKLMEHLKLFCTRVNIPRLITICDRQMLWRELTFLYEKYDEFDNALEVMMAHDAIAWEHVRFKDVAVKCSTVDIFYKAIQHYFDHHPDLVVDLLKVLEGRVDHTRVVALVRRGGHLGVVKDYLLAVQKNNLPSVNEAANELHIAEDDYAALDASVEGYDNFDQLKLAEELEKHKLIAFRRIAAKVYKKNLKWKKAVNMATKDGLFTDAMETAAQSASTDLVKDLLAFFVQAKDPHCFAACLFTCQALVDFHTAIELAWLNQQDLPGVLSLCMPFFVAAIREYTGKVDLLMADRAKALEAQESANKDGAPQMAQGMHAPLMLTAGPTGYVPQAPPGYGAAPTGYAPPPGYGMVPPTNGMGMGMPPGQPYM